MQPMPELLTQLLREQYGDLTDSVVDGFTRPRPVTLRVNTLKSNLADVTAALTGAGIRSEAVAWYSDALILHDVREDAVTALPLYEKGHVYLQSLSAMVPALVLDPKAGDNILDMAAAPGGKTTQMAALSDCKAMITACEKNKIRADRLRFNLDRQGAGRVNVMNTDARQLDDFFKFDKILLDAPCTGSGTVLLMDSEQPRRMTADWVKKTAATQTAMLHKALTMLRPGHEMVYSTCSILQIENEGVLNRVLGKYNAKIVPIDSALASSLPCLPTTLPGTLCIRPTELFEGFYVAKIRKG